MCSSIIITVVLLLIAFVSTGEQASYKETRFFPAVQKTLPVLEALANGFKPDGRNETGYWLKRFRPEDIKNSYKFFAHRPFQPYMAGAVYRDALIESFGDFDHPKDNLSQMFGDEKFLQQLVDEYFERINQQRRAETEKLLRGSALLALVEALSCPQNVAAVHADRDLIRQAAIQLKSTRRRLDRSLTLNDSTIVAISELEEAAQIMAMSFVKAVEYAFDKSLTLEVRKSVFMDILHDEGHLSGLPEQDEDALQRTSQYVISLRQFFDDYMKKIGYKVNCKSTIWR